MSQTLSEEITALHERLAAAGVNLNATLAKVPASRTSWTEWKNGRNEGIRHKTLVAIRAVFEEAIHQGLKEQHWAAARARRKAEVDSDV